MSEPTNKQLYEKVKAEIYKKHPKHSAYRSGLLVQEYKRQGGTYKGKEKQDEGLNLWFRSKWRNQRDEIGYKYKSDVYRPSVKVNKETPTTFKELSKEEIDKARRETADKGRVSKYNKKFSNLRSKK